MFQHVKSFKPVVSEVKHMNTTTRDTKGAISQPRTTHGKATPMQSRSVFLRKQRGTWTGHQSHETRQMHHCTTHGCVHGPEPPTQNFASLRPPMAAWWPIACAQASFSPHTLRHTTLADQACWAAGRDSLTRSGTWDAKSRQSSSACATRSIAPSPSGRPTICVKCTRCYMRPRETP